MRTMISAHLDVAAKQKDDEDPISSTLLEEGPEFVDLVMKFVNNLPGTVKAIHNAVADRDWQKLKPLVHDLKSVGGSYGYSQVSQLAAHIEVELAQDRYDAFPALLAQLDSFCERICRGAPPAP